MLAVFLVVGHGNRVFKKINTVGYTTSSSLCDHWLDSTIAVANDHIGLWLFAFVLSVHTLVFFGFASVNVNSNLVT